MSTAVPAGSVIRVTAVATKGVQTALNTVHMWAVSSIGTGATDSEIAHYLDSLIGPSLKAFMSDFASYYGTLVQRLIPTPTAADVVDTTSAGPGTAGTTPTPGEVAGLITLKTALAGRAFRGRVYAPFPDRSLLTADQTSLTVPGVGLLGAYSAALVSSPTVVGGSGTTSLLPVIFHRKPNKSGTTTANGFTLVTATLLELLVATQRRRGARGRPNAPPT